MNADAQRLLDLKDQIVTNFTKEDWHEIGVLTDTTSAITSHARLLRSLDFGDQDYAGNVLEILATFRDQDRSLQTSVIDTIECVLRRKYGDDSVYVSSRPSSRKITFAPSVFRVPDLVLDHNLVALMMPFDAGFNPVRDTVQSACVEAGFQCQRADDIWEDSMIIQDVFSLILRAAVVVVDFTGKNPNVLYETGVAHTLGKEVIPLSQTAPDIPFDLRHHRTLLYLGNSQGLAKMRGELLRKLETLRLGIEGLAVQGRQSPPVS